MLQGNVYLNADVGESTLAESYAIRSLSGYKLRSALVQQLW